MYGRLNEMIFVATVVVLLFIFGAAIGSFLNVVIYRTQTGESWVYGRSKCEQCHTQICWYDNIPVVSFLILGGKCRSCHAKLSYSHPVVEGLMGLLFVWWYIVGFVFFQLSQQPFVFLQPLFWLIVGVVLLYIVIIDYKYMLIPETAVVFLTALVVLYRIALTAAGIMQLNDFLIAISGMAATVLFFWGLWYITKGKGFGFGDVQLAVPLALLVGWPELLVWVFISFVLGAVVGLCLIALKLARFGKPIPFGPFLILGACISLIWGNYLVAWYVTLIS